MYSGDAAPQVAVKADRHRAFGKDIAMNHGYAGIFAAVILIMHPGNIRAGSKALEKLQKENPCSWSEIVKDWETQDKVREIGYRGAVEELSGSVPGSQQILAKKSPNSTAPDSTFKDTYLELCAKRRSDMITPYLDDMRRIVFVKRLIDIRKRFPIYNTTRSNKSGHPPHWGGMHILEMESATSSQVTELFKGENGEVRDPDVHWDGDKVLFSYGDKTRGIYEIDVETKETRQITDGYNDMCCIYLPNDDILFSSERCNLVIPCNGLPVVNFFICNKDGKYARQVCFDQAHDFFPSVMSDGQVLFTRWGYNDRTRWHTFDLFTMRPDGTGQLGYYGNASCFPSFISCAGPIPNSHKVVAIIHAKNDYIQGAMVLLDIRQGREGVDGLEFIATGDETPDVYCGEKYRPSLPLVYTYPYPLDEETFLVSGKESYKELDAAGIYFVKKDGRRELLYRDPEMSSLQATVLAPRTKPQYLPDRTDYTRNTADVYVQDVHIGTGLAGLSEGKAKKMRVVALEYRNSGLDWSSLGGGGTTIHPPASLMGGAWDVKVIVGETPIEEDGSVACEVPARVPVYFQIVDEEGMVINSMREWTTFMPGEVASCVGCHEDKDIIPPPRTPIASTPKPLEPFYGPMRGFSFNKEIQPILDEKCISCHGGKDPPDLRSTRERLGPRSWSTAYMNLVGYAEEGCSKNLGTCQRTTMEFAPDALVTYYGYQDEPETFPPYAVGSARSRLITLLEGGHYEVTLTTEEMDKIKCWIDLAVPYAGEWTEDMSEGEKERWESGVSKLRAWRTVEESNIAEYLDQSVSAQRGKSFDENRRNEPTTHSPISVSQPVTIEIKPGGIGIQSPRATSRVEIFDACGRVLIQAKVDAGRQFINTENLPRGLYIAAIGRITRPFVKN